MINFEEVRLIDDKITYQGITVAFINTIIHNKQRSSFEDFIRDIHKLKDQEHNERELEAAFEQGYEQGLEEGRNGG